MRSRSSNGLNVCKMFVKIHDNRIVDCASRHVRASRTSRERQCRIFLFSLRHQSYQALNILGIFGGYHQLRRDLEHRRVVAIGFKGCGRSVGFAAKTNLLQLFNYVIHTAYSLSVKGVCRKSTIGENVHQMFDTLGNLLDNPSKLNKPERLIRGPSN